MSLPNVRTCLRCLGTRLLSARTTCDTLHISNTRTGPARCVAHGQRSCIRTGNHPSRRGFGSNSGMDTTLFVPVPVKVTSNSDDINIGAELTSVDLKAKKNEMLELLNGFYRRSEIQRLAIEHGLDAHLFHQAFISFRKFIIESESLPADLHIILSDIMSGSGHIDDIFPYFMQHSRQVFPMLDCMDDLKKISDLTSPASLYPEARTMKRKIIFHAGPTNSGKTHHALERFSSAKTGVYCGPLKLLANEIHQKTNERGIACDLITGEERKYAHPEGIPSSHVACTVEMTSTTTPYEVAIIDEIQMIKDHSRGWAWTRALLGVCAEEIHVCGEPAAIDLVENLMLDTDEDVEVRRYERLTPLTVLDSALETLDNVRPGDCIVAFSKNDIFKLSRQIESQGKECAVIYGSLPPGTKLSQAKKFNDPKDSCKILVATDAIGMGLNLSIKRIIFNSLTRPTLNEKGEIEIVRLTTSQALQIAGRAGRYGSQFQDGEVTTLYREDLPVLKEILANPVEVIEAGGLHPTAEQIEMFAYQLPDASLSNLMDIFINLSKVNPSYFVCNMDDFKFLADMIQHIPLDLRVRYTFCCAPINKKHPFVCTSFLKFARQFSRNEALTFDWLCRHIRWPLSPPQTIKDLMHLEAVHDVMDLYLWFSYRFMDMFPDGRYVREIQLELDAIIAEGVYHITKLVHASGEKMGGVSSVNDDIAVKKSKGKTALTEFTEAQLQQAAEQERGDFGQQARPKKKKTRSKKSAVVEKQLSEVNPNLRPGGLTFELLREGILSVEMLQVLHDEWQQANYFPLSEDVENSKKKKRRKKKK
ncbi:ATP-dependent RNA helicase SUPV3L1, mitochondrial-like [Ptychodera flava]|uniref:ATP-dependent RNA helicase SUPV3L1, mitochondrial-like n=1 Tax=Ptychodera flava TaxID=63121 RepID=UPI00396A5392